MVGILARPGNGRRRAPFVVVAYSQPSSHDLAEGVKTATMVEFTGAGEVRQDWSTGRFSRVSHNETGQPGQRHRRAVGAGAGSAGSRVSARPPAGGPGYARPVSGQRPGGRAAGRLRSPGM